jgi:hypothetical protein
MARSIVMYCIASLITAANFLVIVALCKLRAKKEAYIVLFTGLTMSNLYVGITFLVRCIYISIGMSNVTVCVAIVGSVMAGLGVYVTHVLLISVDLYISIKRMVINDPLITKNMAVVLSAFTWVVWLAIGAACHLVVNPDRLEDVDKCTVSDNVNMPSYSIPVMLSYFVMFTIISVLHIATIRLLHKSMKSVCHHAEEGHPTPSQVESSLDAQQAEMDMNGEQGNSKKLKGEISVISGQSVDAINVISGQRRKQIRANSTIIKYREHILHTMTIEIVILSVCWGIAIAANMVLILCQQCKDAMPAILHLILVQALAIVPFFSSSLINVFRNRELRTAVVSTICFCRLNHTD